MTHTHPLQDADPKPDADTLLASMNIDINLHVLSLGEDRKTVSDLYFPLVRRPPYPTGRRPKDNAQGSVSLLEVISYWKGPLTRYACEIALWDDLFVCCIENLVLRHIMQGFIDDSMAEPVIDRVSYLRFTTLVQADSIQQIPIDIVRLVYDMIEAFYEKHATDAQYDWFKASGNIPAMVYNFIHTRGCLKGNVLFVTGFAFERDGDRLLIRGVVPWQPPNLDFSFAYLRSGRYRVRPQYSKEDGASFPNFEEEPEYTAVTDIAKSAVVWKRDSFQATVPTINISAKLVTCFPKAIKFEQTARYRIKLPLPALSKLPRHDSFDLESDLEHKLTPFSRGSSWSPQNRKASRQMPPSTLTEYPACDAASRAFNHSEHVDLESAEERTKHVNLAEQSDDDKEDSGLSLGHKRSLENEQNSCWLTEETQDELSEASPSRSRASEALDVNAVPSIQKCSSVKRICIRPQSSKPQSRDHVETESRSSETLDQRVILDNWIVAVWKQAKELAEQAERGPEANDEEMKAYEEIFMDDEEDTSGLGDDARETTELRNCT